MNSLPPGKFARYSLFAFLLFIGATAGFLVTSAPRFPSLRPPSPVSAAPVAVRSADSAGKDTSADDRIPAKANQAAAQKGAARDADAKLHDLDRRAAHIGKVTADRQAALTALRKRIPGVDVQFDPITGSANHVMATGRFLTTPLDVQNPVNGDFYAPVRQFIDENAAVFGHGADALQGTRVTREDVTAHSGMRTVVWQQQVDGVPLYNTVLKANLTKDGALVMLGSHFMSNPVAATQLDVAQRAALVAQPPVDVNKAVSLAAANLGDLVAPDEVVASSQPQGAERQQRLSAPRLSDTFAQLSWLPVASEKARLSWDVTLMSLSQREMFRILVDAQTGEVLMRSSLTNDISDASYRVYADPATKQPYDSPTPFSPGHSTPQSTQPAIVSRSLITLQALDTTASPNGWIDDGGTMTLGNNVDAHLDLANTNPAYGVGTHATSATRVFDFTLDLTQDPATYQNAAITNIFYLCNWYHDKTYTLGFTESAGNFQQNNFGRAGSAGDAVLADVQDSGGLAPVLNGGGQNRNNANFTNFSTPSDGQPGRMQMYLWPAPTPARDGSLDAEIVLHELTHGLSQRLVGGGVGISALQTIGMGEGWSDFYGIALLTEAGDDINGNWARAGYSRYQYNGTFTQNYYFGGRRYPYSTNLLKNPLTFKDIDPTQASPHSGIPVSPLIGSAISPTASEVHNVGEVWCVTLWDARANLINKHGFATGNQLILQLVTDGMKLSPADPNFLQARNAIIQADLVKTGGANAKELWAAFAKRGMGMSATSPASSTTTGLVEAYDLSDDLMVSPFTSFTFRGAIAGPFTPQSAVYTLTNISAAPLNWTANNLQPWLQLSQTSGSLPPGASTTVTASPTANANTLALGSYTDTVTFTNLGNAVAQSRLISLKVNQGYYVNDSSLTNDIWCTAVGNDLDNDGKTQDKPKATVQSVLSTYDLEPGDIVRIDTGTYDLTTNITVGDPDDGGSATADVVFEASPYGTVMNRGSGIAWNFVASYVTLQTAQSNLYPALPQSSLRLTSSGASVVASDNLNPHHVTLRRIEVVSTNSAGRGISVNSAAVTIENCLVRGASTGVAFGASTSYIETVRNCTLVGFSNRGIDGFGAAGLLLSNNIVVADGAGKYALYTSNSGPAMVSDNNCLLARNGAAVGYYNGLARSTLFDWQAATGKDVSSISVDPLFVNAAANDYHLQSTAGSYHGGAFTADAADSLCLDAGDPSASVGDEPSPNGGRVNLGAYGSTGQASLTPAGRRLVMVSPNGGENVVEPRVIYWNTLGTGWQAGDTVRLEYSVNGGNTWLPISGAASLAYNAGQFLWDVSALASRAYKVRVVNNADAAVADASDGVFLVRNVPVVFYVNDSSLTNDIWCSAVGNDANDGATPATPKLTVQSVLSIYDLEPGDVVCIDTGTYSLTTDINVGIGDGGSTTADVVFEASPYGTVMDRVVSSSSTVYAWKIDTSYVMLRTAQSNVYPALAQSSLRLTYSGAGTGSMYGILSTNTSYTNLTISRIETAAKTYGIIAYGSNVIVENCLVRGGNRGVSFDDGNGTKTVRNCTVVGFSSMGIYCYYGSALRLNNSIVVADFGSVDAIRIATSSPSMVSDNNCLVGRNGANIGYYNGLERSTLADWQAATGKDANSLSVDLSVDPLFVNAAAGNYHLSLGCRCRDAGDNSVVSSGSLDMDGHARIYGPAVDIGADEAVPSVSVTASDPYAQEGTADAGTFLFTRDSYINLPLAVTYTLGGTATNGLDYGPLSGSVAFAAGSATASVTVSALADGVIEGDESVILTLSAGLDYTPGAGIPGTVSIHDAPLDLWRVANFTPTELADPAISGLAADRDRDGLSTLMEYFLGLNPNTNDRPPLQPGAVTVGPNRYLTLEFSHAKSAADVGFAVEATGALGSWPDAAILHSVTDEGATERLLYRDTVPMDGASQRFIRLRVNGP